MAILAKNRWKILVHLSPPFPLFFFSLLKHISKPYDQTFLNNSLSSNEIVEPLFDTPDVVLGPRLRANVDDAAGEVWRGAFVPRFIALRVFIVLCEVGVFEYRERMDFFRSGLWLSGAVLPRLAVLPFGVGLPTGVRLLTLAVDELDLGNESDREPIFSKLFVLCPPEPYILDLCSFKSIRVCLGGTLDPAVIAVSSLLEPAACLELFVCELVNPVVWLCCLIFAKTSELPIHFLYSYFDRIKLCSLCISPRFPFIVSSLCGSNFAS